MLRTTSARHPRRRGAILLVVLTMLALFAVIGLSFVLYAESEANAARIAKQGVNRQFDAIDSREAVNGFLGQLVYQQNVGGSALYGHELSRLIYGNAAIVPGNTVPYNGVGIYSETLNLQAINPTTTPTALPLHRSQVVRYGDYYPDPTNTTANPPFVRILPDVTYAQNGYVPQGGPNAVTPVPTNLHEKYVGRNAPYTYPDRNNISIAVLDAKDGRVVKPSFHADTLFGSLAVTNPNWYTPQGHFQTLRTRTVDNLTLAEMNYLKGLSPALWPVPANPTPAQITQLATILTGQSTDPNAPITFEYAFPFVAANPDGSLTGDVQNIKFGEGQQANDSVWIDPQLPLVTFRNRRLKPMIAATILAMDGRVNYNAAGNLVATANAHGSNQGFAAHEVNLSKLFAGIPSATTASELVKERYGAPPMPYPVPSPANSTRTTQLFDAGVSGMPASYSRVDFDGNGAAQPTAATGPGGPNNPTGAFSTSLDYPVATYGNSQNGEATLPPAFYNPFQWNPLTTSGTASAARTNPVVPVGVQFPLIDTRYQAARYSDSVGHLRGTNLGRLTEFRANTPQHPMNRARALLTPVSNRLARPGLAPMYFGNAYGINANTGTTALALTAGQAAPVLAAAGTPGTAVAGPVFSLDASTPPAQPSLARDPSLAGALSGGDIVSANSPIAAGLGALFQGVDLNRPLRDYRNPATRPTRLLPGPPDPVPNPAHPVDPNTNWPMDPTTVTAATAATATADRQALATDIFRRLAVAMNARVYFSPSTGLTLPQPTGPGTYTLTAPPTVPPTPPQTWTVSQQEYDALRWIAQLSVNIVESLDGDDVSTPFVWNVTGGDPTNAANYTAAALNDRVVFGVEKPKLVVNEVYAEVANKQTDYAASPSATHDYEARFWIELLNPSNAERTNAAPTAAADQSPRNGGATPLNFPTAPTPFSPYRVQVFNDGIQVHTDLNNSVGGNVLGNVTTVGPVLQVPLEGLTPGAGTPNATVVEPNNGAFSAVGAGGSRNGFCVIGPQLVPATTESPATAYAPKTGDTNSPESFMLMKPLPDPLPEAPAAGSPPLNELAYTVPKTGSTPMTVPAASIPADIVNPLNTRGHAVVLQRLANPYMPPNDPAIPVPAYNSSLPFNPFVTVDYMADIKVNDAIRVGNDPDNPANTTPRNGDRNAGTPATPARPDANFAQGRCQPFAGFQPNDPANVAFKNYLPTPLAPAPVPYPPPPFGPPTAPSTQQATLTVPQNPQQAGPGFTVPTNTEPRLTMFRHNSSAFATNGVFTTPVPPTQETLSVTADPSGTPGFVPRFHEPRVHDRKFVSPLELLDVATVPPFRLTHTFARPNGTAPTTPLVGLQELVQQLYPAAGTPTPPAPPFYRALDVLNVKPWTYGVPHAGRTPGGINLNMVWDETGRDARSSNNPAAAPPTPPRSYQETTGSSTVFQAMLDPQTANGFDAAAVDRIWQNLRKSRSPNWKPTNPAAVNGDPVPPRVGVTVDEIDPATGLPGTDRPFKGFGVGQYNSVGTTGILDTPAGFTTNDALPVPNSNGHGLSSTFLRAGPVADTSVTPSVPVPLFALPTVSDPHARFEPLRKILNNASTTSDTFLVVFTIGYFDIDEPSLNTTGRVVLRREAYDQVPGDLREQFTAVIDRSGLAVNPNAPTSGQTGKFAQAEAATTPTQMTAHTLSGRHFVRHMLRFPAIGYVPPAGTDPAYLQLRDNPTANGSTFKLGVGSQIRLGDGPTAEVLTVTELGAPVNYGGTPAVPAQDVAPFDPTTGLGTICFEVEVTSPTPAAPPAAPYTPVTGARFPLPHAAGELIALPDNEANPSATTVFVPGNPGAVSGFTPTDPRFRGVVRYFGRLTP